MTEDDTPTQPPTDVYDFSKESADHEPQHVDHEYGIGTHFERYRYVLSVRCDSIGTRIVVHQNADTYDVDAVVGACVRHFDLELVEATKQGGQTLLQFE